MKAVLILILGGWISLWTYYYVCWHQGHCGSGAARLDEDLRSQTITYFAIEGEDLEVYARENVRFARSGALPIVPDSTQEVLKRVKNYFDEHDDEALVITAYYDETEENNSLAANLGWARAEAFKNYLLNLGISAEQLATQAEENINLTFSKDTLLDGLAFKVIDELPEIEEMDDEELLELKEKLSVSSHNVYFNTGDTTLVVGDSLRQHIQQLKTYLQQEQEAQLNLIGHTDNVGDAKNNLEYGKQRAEFVRRQLIASGIAAAQINTDSKGESEPIASNEDAEGRSKNRRVEIKLMTN
ncbi:OmpA family protein [Porifericola rhodea]|uniref:OmpA family protein n=1 Tax=Porifericola rhodea TaxID=930972 RepID=UPI0026662705|nr:OmpA family protein [Porifericola rhodea]WKN30158.1 OmpA family protein [Porifericola rhodea]